MFFRKKAEARVALPPVRPHGPTTKDWTKDRRIEASLRQRWIEDGFVVLPSVFDASQIGAYNEIVAKVRRDVDDGKDAYGYGDRIGQLHQKEPKLLELASAPQILTFLDWAFGDEPVLMGSLNFQRGTQQQAHIDAIFFWPEPCYAMAGAWVALEDIHPDAGPLFYIPGSHRWPFFHSDDVVRSRPELANRRDAAREGRLPAEEKGPLIGALADAWTEDLIRLHETHRAERVPISLRAGDVVIWHSLLAHGGSPRNNPAMSRLSAVFHYFGRSAGLFTFDQFMLYGAEELPHQTPQGPALHQYGALSYMRFPQFVTYSGGREIIHPLE